MIDSERKCLETRYTVGNVPNKFNVMDQDEHYFAEYEAYYLNGTEPNQQHKNCLFIKFC